MAVASSLPARAATLSVGVVLLLSLLLPVHGAGRLGHGGVAVVVVAGSEVHAGHHGAHSQMPPGDGPLEGGSEVGSGEASGEAEDPHPLAACCTGPCVCPPVPSPPVARGVTPFQSAPATPLVAGAGSAASLRGPLPHVLPFSTAPPHRV